MSELTRRAWALGALGAMSAVASPSAADAAGKKPKEDWRRNDSQVDDLRAWRDDTAIRRVIALYGQLLDDRRFDEWADLFLDDAVVMGYAGREAFLKGIAGSQPPTPTKHIACSTIVDLAGDQARAWTDAIALLDIGAGPNGSRSYAQFPMRYYDEFVRVDGRWRIARRDSTLPGATLPSGAQKTPAR